MATSASPVATLRQRVDSVDLLRGVIMVLMALDHTRDFFGSAAVNPTNLAATTAPLFFTRWITHFCAPTFFLLTGTGAYLARRHRSTPQLSRFLVTRGLWLIFLEFTVMRFFWQGNIDYHLTVLTVLWALGWSMIVLGGLVFLPTPAVAGFGALLVLLHNLTDGITPQSLHALAPLWTVLHVPGVLWANDAHMLFDAYPLIPWVGVTALGYALGQVITFEPARRKTFLLKAGAALTAAFVLLRALNVYGDPLPWKAQHSTLFTVLSFINTNKYPPSLLFLLMTLGPGLLFLYATDGRTPKLLAPALTIGRVPMFYYVFHVVVLHTLAIAASLVRFGQAHWMFESPTLDKYPITQQPGWPLPLPWVYLAWITVVLIMYPLCRRYAVFKARRTDWWLSYL